MTLSISPRLLGVLGAAALAVVPATAGAATLHPAPAVTTTGGSCVALGTTCVATHENTYTPDPYSRS